MTGETKECNNCSVDTCNRKESKKRTKFFDMFKTACDLFRPPTPLMAVATDIAVWGELRRFGEIRNVSKLGYIKFGGKTC